MYRRALLTFACLLLATISGQARSHHHRASSRASTFDYYLLALSYAPDFCDQASGNKNSAECGAGRRTGFVVHGLWPQGESSRGPERCGSASPVSDDLIRIMLNYFPTASLIQHEWADHGTCTDLSAADYFTLVRKARDAVKIPAALTAPSRQLQLDPQSITAQLAAANPRFPSDAFRVTCYPNAELQEARVCFDKDINPRSCTASAGACPAPNVTLLPVR